MVFYHVTPDRDRPAGWKLISAFGIPIYIEPSFLLFMGLIFLMSSGSGPMDVSGLGILCFVIFFSLLIHEFGHAIVAKSVGCDSIRIALIMFGGYATHSPTTRGRSLLITLAGPFFTLMLLIAANLLLRLKFGDPSYANSAIFIFLRNMAFLNLLWLILNLMPVYPLDGGQALFHGLTYWIDQNKAMRWVARVSLVICVIGGILAMTGGQTFVAIFCAIFFFNNFKTLQALG